MTREEFKKELDRRGYEWKEEGGLIIVGGSGKISIGTLKSIPNNVEFRNIGYVDLESLKSIPDNVSFRNKGFVYLPLLSIPINSDAEEIFQNSHDIKINGKWLDLQKNITFPNSRWTSVDTGKVKMYESWIKNNY